MSLIDLSCLETAQMEFVSTSSCVLYIPDNILLRLVTPVGSPGITKYIYPIGFMFSVKMYFPSM